MTRFAWSELYSEVAACSKCGLAATRNSTVIGAGNPTAEILFVGEGPGREEDIQGLPFVGPAGQLLDKMLGAISLSREEVYIANIVKCRPPGNRVPADDEAVACLPYLRAQTALIRPKIIVCLGKTAATYIYDPMVKITKDRGRWKERHGVWLIATYHPAALLRDASKKRDAWTDMQAIKNKLLEIRAQAATHLEEQNK